jgi:hypothetical protein
LRLFRTFSQNVGLAFVGGPAGLRVFRQQREQDANPLTDMVGAVRRSLAQVGQCGVDLRCGALRGSPALSAAFHP